MTRQLQLRGNRVRVSVPDAVKEGFLEEETPSSSESLTSLMETYLFGASDDTFPHSLESSHTGLFDS